RTNCYSFTAINDTLWLQQIVYSWCNPNTYSFTWSLYTAGCAGPIASGNIFALGGDRITGLVVGTTYRICYTLQSACTWDSVVWPFAYTTSTALPVEMISFGATPYKDKVKIYWATASEDNAKEFIIEKTGNGQDFTEIAQLKASGNSTSLLNYKCYDDKPSPGENFYRLKQVDNNGEISYSRIVSAKFLAAAADFNIIPNPARDKVTIRFHAAENYPALIQVTNVQGKTVWSKQFIAEEGVNECLLNMNDLARGIYSVQLIVDDQNMVSKLVKE
ncbi:MAG: T9SS type A sorting domain-containing protein, partial [Bacteroidota bacterium]